MSSLTLPHRGRIRSTNPNTKYSTPQGTSALPLTFHFNTPSSTILVIGTGKLAATRIYTFLDAGAKVLVGGDNIDGVCEEIRYRLDVGQVDWVELPSRDDTTTWSDSLNFIEGLSLVTITDTLLTSTSTQRRSLSSATTIYNTCKSLHLPINTTDHPILSTYTFPAVARFPSTTPGEYSPLQIAVSTNGKGCRLAGRIKRELEKGRGLPVRDVGRAVEVVGGMRRAVKEVQEKKRRRVCEDEEVMVVGRERRSSSCLGRRLAALEKQQQGDTSTYEEEDDQVSSSLVPLNSPVPQLISPGISRSGSGFFTPTIASVTTPNEEDDHLRRMRWISQISEYWSFEYLARMGEEEVKSALGIWKGEAVDGEGSGEKVGGGNLTIGGSLGGPSGVGNGLDGFGGSGSSQGVPITTRHGLSIPSTLPPTKKGKILLLGSGPGHPSLLTVAAHQALLTSTLILSDKLVPAEILALIPKSTTLHIAKKFPGNAEGAQNEMMQLALEGALRGETVVRLKQGDPFVYGRGGEEVLFFRENGFESVVVPGVSSALAGPLMMGIPVTQRGVAESMVLCTGVGRKGRAVQLPGYVRARTLVVLMGVARIKQVLEVLTGKNEEGGRDGAAYPKHLPIAIIERASSHDQRMVASTLEGIEDALERAGEQRPPGMMIIGWAALALEGEGEVTVLDEDESKVEEMESRDKSRVEKWLGGKGYILKDGLSDQWNDFLSPEMKVRLEEAGVIQSQAGLDTYQEYNRTD